MTIVFEAFTGPDSFDGTVKGPLTLRTLATDIAGGLVLASLSLTTDAELDTEIGPGTVQARVPMATRAADVAGGFVVASYTLATDATGDMPAPDIAVLVANLTPFRVQASGFTTQDAEVTGRLNLSTLTTAARSIVRAHLDNPVYATDGLGQLLKTGFLLQQPMVYASVVKGLRVVVEESFGLAPDGDAMHVLVRTSHLGIGGRLDRGLLDAIELVSESLSFGDVAGIVWNLIYQQAIGLAANESLSVGILVGIAEALALSSGEESLLLGFNAVAEALRLADQSGYVWPANLQEIIGLAGSSAMELAARVYEAEQMALSGASHASATFVSLVPESFIIGDAESSAAELLAQIKEGLPLLVRLNLPDGQYIAWVCNTAGRAFTTYRNFPFNSFCEIDGHYYGATDTGIYVLEGDDDDGVPIDAHVRTGLYAMGNGKLTRLEAMYLGYRSTGDLVLKVVTTSDGGEKTESWYSVEARPADVTREGRAKVGRGLKSAYWGFELANVDGGDFDLDKIAFLPVVTERRIS